MSDQPIILQTPSHYSELHQNTKLIRGAIAQRWPVDPALKEAVLERAKEWLANGSLSAKEQAAWAKVIVAAEAQNQADEQRREEYQRLDEGKLTANSGHTLLLDLPIRPQKQITTVVTQGEPPKITDGTQAQLPPPSDIKENAAG